MRPGSGFRSRAAAVLLLAAVAILAIGQYTGLVSNVLQIGVNISSSSQGDIYIISLSDVVTQDTQTNFTFALDNIGSRTMEGNIYVEIRDSGNATVDSFTSGSYSLQPGSYITYLATWFAVLQPGNYTLIVWDNTTAPSDSDQSDFLIHCIAGQYRCFGSDRRVCAATSWNLVEACTYGCSGGACLTGEAPGGGGGGVSEAGPSYSMVVESEGSLDAVQGIDYTYIIRVTNDGSSPLTNLTLRAWSDEIDVRVPDMAVSALMPGESASFVLDLGIPAIGLGSYDVHWEVRSGEIARQGRFIVNVVSSMENYTAQERCSDSIERYFGVLDSLERDIRSAEIRGYDMESTRELLAGAAEEIEVMRTLEETGLYEECGNRVDILRRKIEQAAMVYSIAISRPVSIIAYPWIEQFMLVFTVISLALVIAILIGWRRLRSWLNRHRLYLPKKW